MKTTHTNLTRNVIFLPTADTKTVYICSALNKQHRASQSSLNKQHRTSQYSIWLIIIDLIWLIIIDLNPKRWNTQVFYMIIIDLEPLLIAIGTKIDSIDWLTCTITSGPYETPIPYKIISFRHCDLNSCDRLLTARNPIRTGVGCSNRTYRNRQPYLIGQTQPTNLGSFHLRYGDTGFYRRLTNIHRCQWSIARGEGPLSKLLLWSRPQRW